MAYTTIDNPELYFQTKTYTGNGSTQSITLDGSENMQPDLIWLKDRDNAYSHLLVDSVRGNTKTINSNENSAEGTASDRVTSFDSDGFSLGSYIGSNKSSSKVVSWNWKAGTSFTNDASSTGVGTIDSTGSFSNDSGISIVSYTGTGSNGTIKHGLNAKPKIILWKRLDNSAGAVNWIVQSTLFGNQTKLVLNTTEAFSTNSSFSQTDNWTSSLIDLKTYEGQNSSSATYVAYCFAEKKGYSKIGSYIGSGSAGTASTFVYTGFRPAWVMIKNTADTHGWSMTDNKRNGYNENSVFLYANEANADAAYPMTSFYSNGFQPIEAGADKGATNDSGVKYIYMAFAESPFVNSSGIPDCAR